MTNLLSSSPKKKFITPENSLLFIPIFTGIIIFLSLLTFVFKPLVTRLSNEESQIKVFEEKISYIPLYEKYIQDISLTIGKAQRQQKRMIELISDPNELETILSEIDNICTLLGIDIISIEPQKIIKTNTNPSSLTSNESNLDPLLISSLEKHILKLDLKGDFNKFVSFFKELELLQTITIAEDIKLFSIPTWLDFNISLLL